MKIKSLLLGSIALAGVSGLAANANAADLAQGTLTSLDVCDALGLSGLTISSDSNCLSITGGVSYMFQWGDYESTGSGTGAGSTQIVRTGDDNVSIPTPGYGQNVDPTAYDSANDTSPTGPSDHTVPTSANANDWDSQTIAWLQAVGTADSDFGRAKAVIKLKSEQYIHSRNGYTYYDGDDTGGATTNGSSGSTGFLSEGHSTNGLNDNAASGQLMIDQAYVSIGDSTVLTAGKAGSIVNTGDDEPFNYLGLFNSSNVGTGVLWSVKNYAGNNDSAGDTGGANVQTGGHVIQIVSSLGNGLTLSGGLEDLQDHNAARAGTAIGVVSYASDTLTAHLSLLATGVLDGHPDDTAYHAGFTGTFNNFQIRAAIAGDSSGYYDGLATAAATFDMFKVAVSGEFTHVGNQSSALPPGPNNGYVNGQNSAGFGASITATVSPGVSLNLGGRYFDMNTATPDNEGYQLAASVAAAVTETITLTGEVGYYGSNLPKATPGALGDDINYDNDVYYGSAQVAWAPGGGFTTSLKGAAYSNGAYQATFNAAKTFQ